MRLFTERPRIVWRCSHCLLPLWALLGAILYGWVDTWSFWTERIEPTMATTRPQGLEGSEYTLSHYDCIWQRSLKQTLVETQAPAPPKPTGQQERPVQLALLGTAVEKKGSCAFIKLESGEVKVVQEGSLLDSFVVSAIHPDRVCLNRGGVLSYIRLPEDMRKMVETRAQPAGSLITAPEPGLSEGTGEKDDVACEAPVPGKTQTTDGVIALDCSLQDFLDSVRLVPNIAAKETLKGFRIDSVASDSPVARSGLIPGDVILTVDERELRSVTDMEVLCSSLEDGNRHRWGVARRDLKLEVRIEPRLEVKSEST